MNEKKSLDSQLNSSSKNNIAIVYNMFNLALEMIKKNPNLFNVTHKASDSIKNKLDSTINVDYECPAARIIRNYKNDYIFPLETVQLKIHETEHDETLEGATIHTGSYADEITRSLHVLAFATGKNIFFRNGSYKPETEEGRALLAHELKHVSQFKENPSEDNRTTEQLESEAIKEEQKEIYESDPFVEIKVHNKTYKVRKSQLVRIEKLAEKELEKWIEEQEHNMTSQEYLDLLCKYEKYMGGK